MFIATHVYTAACACYDYDSHLISLCLFIFCCIGIEMELDHSISNCTSSNSTSDILQLKLSRCLTAAICVCPLIVMLVVLCYSKAYTSLVQRLFLYLILAATITELCFTATLEHQFHYSTRSEVCIALGILTQWSSLMFVLCAGAVIGYTILLVCIMMKCDHYLHVSLSQRRRFLLESLYLVLVVLLPLLILWMPFMEGSHGLAVAWCWTAAVDNNCGKIGIGYQFIIDYVIYEAVGVMGILAMVGMTAVYCRLSSTVERVKKLLLQSLTLLSFLLLYILVISIALCIRIYSDVTGRNPPVIVLVVHGAIIPLCHLIIPFGFLGSYYFSHFKKKCCKRRFRRAHYENLAWRDPNKTAPLSERRSAPSSTYFNVSYTNGFTSV